MCIEKLCARYKAACNHYSRPLPEHTGKLDSFQASIEPPLKEKLSLYLDVTAVVLRGCKKN